MKKPSLSLLAVLMLSSPAWAQDAEPLKQRLQEKEAEVQLLKERIRSLERQLTPLRIATNDPDLPMIDAESDSDRALERALVRERGLLLSAGIFEIEPNFVYSHIDRHSTNFKRDAFGPGLSLRIGLPGRFQLEVGVPYVWERREIAGVSTRADGIGDAYLALSTQLMAERAALPGVIGTLGYQFSSGRNSVFSGGVPVALGSGFDWASAGITLIKRADPLIYFGNYTVMHSFSESKGGIHIDPGNSHNLRFGTALATSPGTSLRAAFSLRLLDKIRADGVRLTGTDDPVGMLELGGAARMNASTAIDVMLGIGVTHSAPDFRIGLAIPIRF